MLRALLHLLVHFLSAISLYFVVSHWHTTCRNPIVNWLFTTCIVTNVASPCIYFTRNKKRLFTLTVLALFAVSWGTIGTLWVETETICVDRARWLLHATTIHLVVTYVTFGVLVGILVTVMARETPAQDEDTTERMIHDPNSPLEAHNSFTPLTSIKTSGPGPFDELHASLQLELQRVREELIQRERECFLLQNADNIIGTVTTTKTSQDSRMGDVHNSNIGHEIPAGYSVHASVEQPLATTSTPNNSYIPEMMTVSIDRVVESSPQLLRRHRRSKRGNKRGSSWVPPSPRRGSVASTGHIGFPHSGYGHMVHTTTLNTIHTPKQKQNTRYFMEGSSRGCSSDDSELVVCDGSKLSAEDSVLAASPTSQRGGSSGSSIPRQRISTRERNLTKYTSAPPSTHKHSTGGVTLQALRSSAKGHISKSASSTHLTNSLSCISAHAQSQPQHEEIELTMMDDANPPSTQPAVYSTSESCGSLSKYRLQPPPSGRSSLRNSKNGSILPQQAARVQNQPPSEASGPVLTLLENHGSDKDSANPLLPTSGSQHPTSVPLATPCSSRIQSNSTPHSCTTTHDTPLVSTTATTTTTTNTVSTDSSHPNDVCPCCHSPWPQQAGHSEKCAQLKSQQHSTTCTIATPKSTSKRDKISLPFGKQKDYQQLPPPSPGSPPRNGLPRSPSNSSTTPLIELNN
eukprot:TRINITY_DN112374_c0_g1_i1.p1 TRINITY_DN112374_c0_g1~~TRINITY_DN112374_c0_g1_i1.p1  ORF type:complete len:687 (-),score=-1.97 TRINITY_DN112374_c0_g1_i1:29-2089(-)